MCTEQVSCSVFTGTCEIIPCLIWPQCEILKYKHHQKEERFQKQRNNNIPFSQSLFSLSVRQQGPHSPLPAVTWKQHPFPHTIPRLKGKGTINSEKEIAKITKLIGVNNFSQKLPISYRHKSAFLIPHPTPLLGKQPKPSEKVFSQTFQAKDKTSDAAILEYFARTPFHLLYDTTLCVCVCVCVVLFCLFILFRVQKSYYFNWK